MPDPLPFIYWDACIFLSYINGDARRLPDIDALLDHSGKDFQIITSMFSVIEVAFAKIEQDGKALKQKTEAKIDALWAPGSPVKLVEFHFEIATEARAIIRAGLSAGLKTLKPKDAIHIATAKMISCKEFHTYDTDLEKYSEVIGIKIGPPLARQLALPSPPSLPTVTPPSLPPIDPKA